MLCRLSNQEDQSQLIELSNQIYDSIDEKAQYNWPIGSLKDELLKTQCLLGEQDARIVCFVCFRDLGDVLEISVLGTEPKQQKKGFQRQLLVHLQEIAARQRKGLLLEVHQRNTKALHLYQGIGFVLLNVRKKYYSDMADALVMRWDQQ